ncbi:MAG: bifunctional DNA-formamidopyrimidine glycosylase/DNA-(apurinic or apyrimidinic site) lyase, partial [Spirochaetota bacterium]
YIIFAFDSADSLLVHLKMSGRFEIQSGSQTEDKHHHVILNFEDGRELCFHDPRKFGRMILTNRPESVLGSLGPEPFDPLLTPPVFHCTLNRRKRLLKPLLLDQSFLGGLGNIYADEALWLAYLHPERGSHTLNPDEGAALLKAIRTVLSDALNNRGTSLGHGEANFAAEGEPGNHRNFLKVYQRKGEPCPRCGTPITRLVVGQRGTHICPQCQRKT